MSEGVIPCGNHSGGMPVHKGSCRDLKAAQHFILAPPSDESDGIWVNGSEKERHGASCPERPCGDFTGDEAQGLAHVVAGGPET